MLAFGLDMYGNFTNVMQLSKHYFIGSVPVRTIRTDREHRTNVERNGLQSNIVSFPDPNVRYIPASRCVLASVGALSYYGRGTNLSSKVYRCNYTSICVLLRTHVQWVWTISQAKSFRAFKMLCTNCDVIRNCLRHIRN